MNNYCTVSDVMEILTIYTTDLSDNNASRSTITPEYIEAMITQASEHTRIVLAPRFDLAIIDAYDPDYPQAVVRLTALYASRMVLARQGVQSTERNRTLQDLLAPEISAWERQIASGSIRDTLGAFVANQLGPTQLTPAFNSVIGEVYSRGSRYYD